MAEIMATVGFVSAIVQLVDFGSKVLARLNDYRTAVKEVPKAFRGISNELPLVLNTLNRTKEQSQCGRIDKQTQEALIPVVKDCSAQVNLLDAILVEVLPGPGDRRWRKTRKAFSSVWKEKEINDITKTLKSYVRTLTYYEANNAARNSLPSTNIRKDEPKRTYYIVPALSVSRFIKRDDLMERMQDSLGQAVGPSSPVVVLLGMGGQGKSLLAMEFCKLGKADEKYQAIFWIDATSERSLARSLEKIASKFSKGRSVGDLNSHITFVKDTIESWTFPWLLVFDNYDRPDEMLPIWSCFPQSKHGSIIVTSRHASSERLGSVISLMGMLEEQSLDLLFHRSKLERTEDNNRESKMIVNQLGHHPLAIDQAGSYIKARGLSLGLYLTEYHKNRAKILKYTPDLTEYRKQLSDSDDETALNAFTTMDLSLRAIQGSPQDRSAKEQILTISAFLSHQNISSTVLRPYVDSVCTDFDGPGHSFFAGTLELDLDDILVELNRLSLLQSMQYIDEGIISYSLHPLIRDWAKLRLDAEIRCQYIRFTVAMLSKSLPQTDQASYPQLPANWIQELFSHIDICMKNCQEYLHAGEVPGVGSLYEPGYKIAYFCDSEQTRARIPSQIYERALSWLERNHPDMDEEILKLMVRLSYSYERIREYDLAEEIGSRALVASETLPPEHFLRGFTLIRMGEITRRQGWYPQAIEYLQEGIVILRKTVGLEHQNTLKALGELASLYRDLRQYEIAKQYAQETLNGKLSLYGAEHFSTIISKQKLALILHACKQFEEAGNILSELRIHTERVYGEWHELTLKTNSMIADSLCFQGKYAEAEPLLAQVADRRAEVFGRSNPITLKIVGDIAHVQLQQGKYDEAEATIYYGLDRCDETIPHFRTKHRLQSLLVDTYQKQERQEEAEMLVEIIIEAGKDGKPKYYEESLWQSFFLYATGPNNYRDQRIEPRLDEALQMSENLYGFDTPRGRKNLAAAILGYEMLENPEKHDMYTGKLLEQQQSLCRPSSDLSTSDQIEFTEAALTTPLPSPLTSLCNALIEEHCSPDKRIAALAMTAIHFSDLPNAQIAFEQLLSRAAFEQGHPNPIGLCDMCDSKRKIVGKYRACSKCFNIVTLHEDCYAKYPEITSPLVVEEDGTGDCIGHDFLEIPRPEWVHWGNEVVDGEGQSLDEWLWKMREMYGDAELPRSIADQIAAWELVT